MKNIFIVFLFLFSSNFSFGQQKKYNFPNKITTEESAFTFTKVSGSSSSYYINYKAENTGDGILLLDRSKSVLLQNEGESYPTSQITMLKPNESKTIYNQFRVKAPIQANADFFEFWLQGVQYAKPSSDAIKIERFVLAEKATQSASSFDLKVMEYNVYSDRIFAEIKCTFNGNGKQLGKIDLSELKLNGGTPKIVKKGDIIQAGKSYTFSINISPNGEDVSIDWGNTFQLMNLTPIAIEKIKIKSTTYKEETDVVKETSKEKETPKKAIEENCALSYADFSTLKKDIQTEMNTGGKAVEMANEFLMEKACINVDQVLEFMAIFNLDGQRLAFAKMAYPYTSDKAKYHLAVAKLSYTKNKQALEEFLEQQL